MARSDDRRKDPHSRAVDTLIRAGRKSEIIELYESYAKSTHARYNAIRNEPGYTDEWKATELDRTYQTFKSSITAELVEKARLADADDRGDAARVFGVAGLPGDTASLTISARDAADRAAQTDTTDDLRALLERADRSGDEVLARAVAQRAVEVGSADIVNDFTSTREHLRDPVERLWDRARRSDDSSATFEVAMHALAVRPS